MGRPEPRNCTPNQEIRTSRLFRLAPDIGLGGIRSKETGTSPAGIGGADDAAAAIMRESVTPLMSKR